MVLPRNRQDDQRSLLPPSAAVSAEGSGLTSLAVGVVIVTTLYVAREVLVPISLAILLSFMLAPVVRLLRRINLPRAPSVVLAVVLALGLILSLGGLIGMQVGQLLSDLPRYADTIEKKITGVRGMVLNEVTGSLGWLGHRIEQASTEAAASTGKAQPEAAANAEPKPTTVIVHQPDPTSLEIAERILAPVISPLATTGIVFIVAIFILLQQADLRDRFIRLFGMQDLHRTTRAIDDAARRLSRYLLTQVGLNAAFGVIIGCGLFVIGVPNPLLWGTLGALFRFIPYIGSLISGALPVALAAAVDPGWSMAIWTAVVFVLSETIMGQFVDPLAYGKSTGLSPVAVVVAAIFWAWMWGPIGLILSMPLTVCLVVLGRHVQRLEFLDVLMGNRPALTPVESFYQRILANDSEEALDQAEMILKNCSLSAYYDDVAIDGLQLVAKDVERGVLSTVQLEQIERSMSRLVEELAGYDDLVPTNAKVSAPKIAGMDPPEMHAEPVPEDAGPVAVAAVVTEAIAQVSILCLSGRGLLDDVVSEMLAQLLVKNGMAGRAETYEAVARGQTADFGAESAAMVCISSLEPTGSPSHLRYLVRRLRDRLPNVPILVGLYPLDNDALDERFRAAVAADYYTTSLKEGVATCRKVMALALAGSKPLPIDAAAA